MSAELPFLFRECAGLPGTLRRSPEDFRVEELSLYPAAGEGDHVYFEIEKRNASTHDAVRRVARALDVPVRSVGYAGQKDARGVTRQWLSVEHVAPAAVEALALEGLRVLAVTRHRNKLRIGHLSGNRFQIVLRDTRAERIDEVRELLGKLAHTGLPNAFGPQRFGNRGDTARIGAALVAGDHEQAARLVAGAPGPLDRGPVLLARELFEQGDFERAARAWPRGYATSARLCLALARSGGRTKHAVLGLGRATLAFYVSAWQAELFNRVLGERMHTAERADRDDRSDRALAGALALDRLAQGDIAWNHGARRAFRVEDAAELDARAAGLEVSPTGPLFGPSMERPSGAAGRLEERVLAESGLALEALDPKDFHGARGDRRPLRVPLRDASVELVGDDGAALALAFTLPAGAYATALVRELCKDKLVEERDDAGAREPAEGSPAEHGEAHERG